MRSNWWSQSALFMEGIVGGGGDGGGVVCAIAPSLAFTFATSLVIFACCSRSPVGGNPVALIGEEGTSGRRWGSLDLDPFSPLMALARASSLSAMLRNVASGVCGGDAEASPREGVVPGARKVGEPRMLNLYKMVH